MTKTIQLTPNYEAMFRLMLADAKQQAQASRMFDCLTADQEARALRSVQRWFAPLAIAANSATSLEAIEQLRSLMSDILGDINQTALAIENDLEEAAALAE